MDFAGICGVFVIFVLRHFFCIKTHTLVFIDDDEAMMMARRKWYKGRRRCGVCGMTALLMAVVCVFVRTRWKAITYIYIFIVITIL